MITFVGSQETWLIITKIPSWPYPKSWTLSQVDNNEAVPLRLQFTMVLLCLGCNPGKWFTQAIHGSPLVPCPGWDVPSCSHLHHTRAPGRLREHLTAQLVHSGDPSAQSIKDYQQISEQGQGGGCTTTSSYFILAKFEKKP